MLQCDQQSMRPRLAIECPRGIHVVNHKLRQQRLFLSPDRKDLRMQRAGGQSVEVGRILRCLW